MTVPLISRKEWGAKYEDGFRDRPMPFSEFWLHHSVTIAPDLIPPFDDDYKAVRTLEQIGENRFGGGISYNQPVTPAGLVFVGVSPHRQGAHTKNHNTVGFAFVLVGDYTSRKPTVAQEERIAQRMVELHRQGKATRHTLNGGHRDASGNSTSCPGNAAEARIPFINARANELWAGGYGAGGTPPTPPVIIGQKIPGTDNALLSDDGVWGKLTTAALQDLANTPEDGIVSNQTTWVREHNPGLRATNGWEFDNQRGGSTIIKWLQAGLNRAIKAGDIRATTLDVDGIFGPATRRALQLHLGLNFPVNDQQIDYPSNTVKVFQRKINTGRIFRR